MGNETKQDVTPEVQPIIDGGIGVEVTDIETVSEVCTDEVIKPEFSTDDLDYVDEEDEDERAELGVVTEPTFIEDEMDVITDDNEIKPTLYQVASDFDLNSRSALILGEEEEVPSNLNVMLGGISPENYEATLEKLYNKYPNWSLAQEDGSPADAEGFMVISSIIKSLDTTVLSHNKPIGKLRNFIRDENTGRQVAVGRVRPKLNKGILSGDLAALDITTTLDGVVRVRVPLAVSGFTIELSNFDGDDLTFLDIKLANNLGELGRSTVGSIRMHTVNLLLRDIINFIVDHMVGHNVADVAPSDKTTIRNLIKSEDIGSLITGANAATKPEGGYVSVMCANPSKDEKGKFVCESYFKGTALYPRTFWIDVEKLTEYQLSILTRPYGERVTIEELAKYAEEFKQPEPVVIENDNYMYEFYQGHSGMDEFLKDGASYINGINNTITRHLGNHIDKATRDHATSEALKQNVLAMYYSTVKRLEIIDKKDGKKSTVTDKQTIVNILRKLNKHPKFDELMHAFVSFTAENPTVLALNVPTCPSCGYKCENDLIVYDPLTSFFTQVLSMNAGLQYIGTPT